MEKEIFSADVQVRRSDERRYGKGKIKITDKYVYINFKKFLGKPQEFKIPRDQIAKAGFRDRGGKDIVVMMPGYVGDLGWLTFDIELKDGSGFTFYIGRWRDYPQKAWQAVMEKYGEIQRILTGKPKT